MRRIVNTIERSFGFGAAETALSDTYFAGAPRRIQLPLAANGSTYHATANHFGGDGVGVRPR